MGNKKKRSKLLVLLLVLAMIFTALPSALADNLSSDNGNPETSVSETADSGGTSSIESSQSTSNTTDVGTVDESIQDANSSENSVVEEPENVENSDSGKVVVDAANQESDISMFSLSDAEVSTQDVSVSTDNGLTKTLTTTSTPGVYNVMLEMSGNSVTKSQPAEYILAIDTSNSMSYSLNNSTRIAALKEALLGTKNTDGTYKGDGVLDVLFNNTPQAKVAIVAYDTAATYPTLSGGDYFAKGTTLASCRAVVEAIKIPSSSVTIGSGRSSFNASGGTNYVAALEAVTKVADSWTGSAGTKKLLFLSDGNPTYPNGPGDNTTYGVSNVTNSAITGFTTGATYSTGTITLDTDYSRDTTNNAVSYKVGSANTKALDRISVLFASTSSYNFLKNLSSGSTVYNPQSLETLKTNLKEALTSQADVTNATITDPLSSYVTYASYSDGSYTTSNISSLTDINKAQLNQPGLQVLKGDGTTWTLLSENTTTTGSGYHFVTDSSGKAIGIQLNDKEKLTSAQYLRLIFPVKVTDSAYQEYFENGTGAYTSTNTSTTDTQSPNTGYYSNGVAVSSGTFDGTAFSNNFNNPIFRVPSASLIINKTDQDGTALGGAQFTISKNGSSQVDPKAASATTTSMNFADLTPGIYVLTESVIPANYKSLFKSIELTVTETSSTAAEGYGHSNAETSQNDSVTVTVSKITDTDGNVITNPTNTDVDALGITISSNGNAYTMGVKNTALNMNLKLNKTNSEGVALSGAVFGLFMDSNCTTESKVATATSDGTVLFYDDTSIQDAYSLKIGQKYYLKEISAPSGFVENDQVYEVVLGLTEADTTISPSGGALGVTIANEETANGNSPTYATVTLKNLTEQQLPLAGGTGNIWLYLIAAGMVAAIAYMIVRNSRLDKKGGRR